MPSRRFVVAGLGTGFAVPTAALAQQHAGHNPLYAHLRDPSATGLPPGAEGQRFAYSPAPPAASPGRWVERSMLPLPRSETAWATAETDRMHVVGGRMDTFHFNTGLHLAYDPAADK